MKYIVTSFVEKKLRRNNKITLGVVIYHLIKIKKQTTTKST
jgi:hypothetical protein